MIIDFAFLWEAFLEIWKAVPTTLGLTAASYVIGLFFAFLIAFAIYYQVPVLQKIFKAYISIIRGTPLMLQLYIVYYAIPMAIDSFCENVGLSFRSASISTTSIVIAALVIHNSAYLAETVRSGLIAMNKGEVEAAYMLGMPTGMVIRRVILPQISRICFPNFASQLISVMHGTSLAFYVTILEVTGTAQILAQDNWKYFETYLAAGLIYWILTILIEVVVHFIERKTNKHISAVA